MAANATSFTSPLADFSVGGLPPQVDYMVNTIANASVMTWVFTLIAVAVAYDQSTY